MFGSHFDVFSRRRKPPVQPGATYSRRATGATVETAQVLSVAKDDMGIDHVRFHISIHRGPNAVVDEDRILNLESFAQRFVQRVPA